MPRPPRLQAPGTLHHLIARGNEKQEVFRDNSDRQDYLDRLAEYRSQFGFRLYAYCLMPNHVHIAAEQGAEPLSRFMHALQSSYTQYFNRRYERVGHLFQGRFKSFRVEGERYFIALIRYIHENPVKAGIVDEAHLYRWSSAWFFRSAAGPEWLDLDRALVLMGGVSPEAAENVPDYEALIPRERVIKGEEEFAREAMRSVYVPFRRSPVSAEAVARAVARQSGVSIEDFASSRRDHSLSRLRLSCAYLARLRFGVPVAEMARLFRRSEGSFANSVRAFERRIEADRVGADRFAQLARDVAASL